MLQIFFKNIFLCLYDKTLSGYAFWVIEKMKSYFFTDILKVFSTRAMRNGHCDVLLQIDPDGSLTYPLQLSLNKPTLIFVI